MPVGKLKMQKTTTNMISFCGNNNEENSDALAQSVRAKQMQKERPEKKHHGFLLHQQQLQTNNALAQGLCAKQMQKKATPKTP